VGSRGRRGAEADGGVKKIPSARQLVRDKRWNTQDGLGVFQDDPVLEERLSQHDR
jgi:hypothetical protein